METIAEVSRFIRDYGQDPRHIQNLQVVRFTWHQLWAALDVIEDTELAIEAYLQSKYPTDIGERYLRLYGLLQVLFVQQDAMRHVIEAIRPAM